VETVVLRIFLHRPYRCRDCNGREYAPVWRAPYGADRKVRQRSETALRPVAASLLVLFLFSPLLVLAERSLRQSVAAQSRVSAGDGLMPVTRRQLVMPAAEAPAPRALTPFLELSSLREEQAPAAQRNDVLGNLRVAGEVFVGNNPVTADQTLFAGDSVRTGASGRASLLMPDRGTLTIFEQTQVSFPSGQRAFAMLQQGRLQLFATQGATRLQIQVGGFLVLPSTETAAEALIERNADGTATVTAIRGSIGVIALEGPAAQFLTPGQQAIISATGEITLAGQQAPTQPAAPSGPRGPGVEKKGSKTPYVLLGVGGGAAAAAAVALAGKKESRPVSPFQP
jgi:hypothetical protein